MKNKSLSLSLSHEKEQVRAKDLLEKALVSVYYIFEYTLTWKFDFITFPDDHKQLIIAPVLIKAKDRELATERANDLAKSFGSSSYFEYIAVFKGAYTSESISTESIVNFLDEKIDDDASDSRSKTPEVTD
jgi:hypothetical protein